MERYISSECAKQRRMTIAVFPDCRPECYAAGVESPLWDLEIVYYDVNFTASCQPNICMGLAYVQMVLVTTFLFVKCILGTIL